MGFNRAFGLGVREYFAAPNIFLGRDGLDFDYLCGSVGFVAEIGEFLRRIFNLMIEGSLLVHMDKILRLLLLVLRLLLERQLPNFYQIFNIIRYLVGSRDLFGKLPLVDHLLPPKEREGKHIPLNKVCFTSKAEEVCILMGWRA